MSTCQTLIDKAEELVVRDSRETRGKKQKKTQQALTRVEKHKHNTHTLPNVNANVSMDVCISPNIAFVLSGVTSLKLMPVESDKTQ